MSKRSLLSLGLPKDSLSLLTRHGYENVPDLLTATPESLARDLGISLEQADGLLERVRKPQTPLTTLPTTQSVATMVHQASRIPTGSSSLNKMLQGGLLRGHVLELSGPPGSPKERLSMSIASAFVNVGEEILFVDCQNMTSSSVLINTLRKSLKGRSDIQRYVHYFCMHTLPELLFFVYQLPKLLALHSKISLLVINSVSFPFQNPGVGISQKNGQLDKLKQGLSKASASSNLTIVTTSQLATKALNADGSSGTFDSGARGVMLPQLGPGYLPNGRSYRILVAPDSPTSGVLKLLSSPKHSLGSVPTIVEPYSTTEIGVI
ncbi:unnamed protein product [Cyclocybe aegerita]|uniref:RecA family profile 1 domain-containing protein n=1 Tax=Cyclocybe aegerita TaxID=1973307 RepID=A0A8S0W647_CYCAE|nr:unnamed protein product [Cyclocybe aegerita]